MVLINSPTDGYDAFGQLGMMLDGDELLDKFLSNGLINGYSVARKLVATATNAFRVRRSSDNAEQDIGFSGNDADTDSLLSFIGANDGFVVTMYDQIGSRDATQASTALQLRVVDSGALETRNSKLIAKHLVTQGDGWYTMSGGAISYASSTHYGVSYYTGLGFVSFTRLAATGDSEYFYASPLHRIRTGGSAAPNICEVTAAISADTLHSFAVTYVSSTGTGSFWLDNVFAGSDTNTSNDFQLDAICRVGANDLFEVSEILFFDEELAEINRSAVNENIDNFYGI